MDKYEYKVRVEEIFNLINEGEFAEAVEIADTIDWSRIRSSKTLCRISDLYKVNRRYQESKEILLMAYDKNPGGRLIVYSLCELSIKLGEIVQALEYYKEFLQIAPKDSKKYILNYRIFEANDVSLEERAAVLEEFKRKDYQEKWAYELAYLYHRMGLGSKCVDECDELIVTSTKPKYTIKAMELKALHEPLTPSEQEKYNRYIQSRNEGISRDEPEEDQDIREYVSDVEASVDQEDLAAAPTAEIPASEMDIQVKPVDVGQYNTMNLQEALAESMKELLDTDEPEDVVPSTPEEDIEDNTIFGTSPMAGDRFVSPEETVVPKLEVPVQEISEPVPQPKPAPQPAPVPQPVIRPAAVPQSDIMAGETKRIPTDVVVDYMGTQMLRQEMQNSSASMQASDAQSHMIPGAVTGQLDNVGEIANAYDQMLAQEYNGQIRLAISEGEKVEKQITGQLSIDDVLSDWEETKKENEKKREEEVRQRIVQHTGSLFDEFDEDTKATLLEQLEKAFRDVLIKESNGTVEDSEALGKKIRREAVRAVESMSREQIAEAPAKVQPSEPEPIPAPEPVAEPEVEEKATEESESTPAEAGTDSIEVAAVREALAEDEEEAKKQAAESKPASTPSAEESKSEGEEEEESEGVRVLTDEEKELFGSYLTRKSTYRQIAHALDSMSMAAYTGNCIITGEEGVGTIDLAKRLIKYMQTSDANFVSSQVAKVSGKGLNDKEINALLNKIQGGAIIIESARGMKKSTVMKLMKALENENLGILAILEDTSEGMDRIVGTLPQLGEMFNVRIDLKALDDKALVKYACEYALSQEHKIDEFALLALHTRIAELQTSTHQVSVSEVRDLVDDAIYYADKKNPGHLFDIILHKRYDDEDMIILREKDFMHY